MCPATCAVRRADATFLPQTGQGTQHGAGCSTARGARWQRQSHASPGGGVGTNFVNARFRLGSPRIHHGTPRADDAEDINVSDHPCVKGTCRRRHSERTRGILGVPGESSSARTPRIPPVAGAGFDGYGEREPKLRDHPKPRNPRAQSSLPFRSACSATDDQGYASAIRSMLHDEPRFVATAYLACGEPASLTSRSALSA